MKIQFEADTTREAEVFLEDNLKRIGGIKKVIHLRNNSKNDYQTTFTGEDGKIIVIGCLSSGYGGTGCHGLVNVLVSLGVKKEKAELYVFDEENKFPTFEIEF